MNARARRRYVVLIVVGVGAGNAHADPGASAPETASGTPSDTPSETPPPPAEEPPPTEASGIARPDAPSTSDQLLVVPRAALFVPRWAYWLATQPVRLGAWSYEKYELRSRWERWLGVGETAGGNFGVYPVVRFESGFGVGAGVRFYHADLFGAKERIRLHAGGGGRVDQHYETRLKSGKRFGERFAVELRTRYEKRGRERFFGIGNGDEVAAPVGLIDPTMDPSSIETRFREDLFGTELIGDVRLAENFVFRINAAAMFRKFSPVDNAQSIDLHYDTMQLPGFTTGTDNLYGEAELRYDSRRQVTRYQSLALDSTGWLATAHAGVMTGIGTDPSEFVRYGGEVRRYINLYKGSRVLALRLVLDAVTGDHVSFIDLPRLGGGDDLRGYLADRFRDRVAGLGSVEYTWELGNFLAAYTFVDAGRVYPRLRDLALRDLRYGYGAGLQVHAKSGFLMRGQLALSEDGDVFVEVAFSPTFGRRERGGRP